MSDDAHLKGDVLEPFVVEQREGVLECHGHVAHIEAARLHDALVPSALQEVLVVVRGCSLTSRLAAKPR